MNEQQLMMHPIGENMLQIIFNMVEIGILELVEEEEEKLMLDRYQLNKTFKLKKQFLLSYKKEKIFHQHHNYWYI